jgi:four helix bundle protein
LGACKWSFDPGTGFPAPKIAESITPGVQMIQEIKSYRDLRVWKEGMELMVEAYTIAKRLPKDELYGLTSQIRRAAVSVPANIAEGQGRDHLGDYLYHLSVAKGSLVELETELLAAERLGYVTMEMIARPMEIADGVGRMLGGLSRTLAQQHAKGKRPPKTEHRTPRTERSIGSGRSGIQ